MPTSKSLGEQFFGPPTEVHWRLEENLPAALETIKGETKGWLSITLYPVTEIQRNGHRTKFAETHYEVRVATRKVKA